MLCTAFIFITICSSFSSSRQVLRERCYKVSSILNCRGPPTASWRGSIWHQLASYLAHVRFRQWTHRAPAEKQMESPRSTSTKVDHSYFTGVITLTSTEPTRSELVSYSAGQLTHDDVIGTTTMHCM